MPFRAKVLAVAFAAYSASTLISMAAMSVGAAFLGVATLFGLGGPRGIRNALAAGWREPWVRRYTVASLALFGACALSLVVAWVSPLEWGGKQVQPLFGDLAKGWYFAWPLLLWMALRAIDQGGRDKVLLAWLTAFGLVAAIGVGQHYTGWPRMQPIPGSEGRFHATGFLGHHLSMASILIFPFFAALDRLKRSPAARGPLLVAVILGFATLFLTYSRMLWVALPAGMMIWALRALPRRQAAAALLAIAFAVAAASQLPVVRRRALDAMGVEDRQAIWKANLEFLRARPLTGTGFRRNIEASALYQESISAPGAPVFVSHAHNNLLDALGGTGVLGAVAWLAWCAVVFGMLGAAVANPANGFAWGLACAWIVFHLNGLTQVNFWEGKVMHQMALSIAWALHWARRPVA